MASRLDMAMVTKEEEQEGTVEMWRHQKIEHRAYSEQMIMRHRENK